jgi:parallel beta-helix repeat protein
VFAGSWLERRWSGCTDSRWHSRVVLKGLALALVAAGCTSNVPEVKVPSLPPTTAPTTTTVVTSTTTLPDDDPPVIEDESVVLGIGDDFQAVVEASPEGTAFVIESGVHRLHEIRPKSGMTFEGQPGSVMSGALVLEDWIADSEDTWHVEGMEMTALEHGDCIEGYEGCRFTQDLYMDDVMLWQVTEIDDLAPGTWLWEGDRIIVADDPGSRRVELSVATYAFMGAENDVTIRGLVVEKYAVPAQFGAIQSVVPGDGPIGSRWVVEDSEVRLNHGAGIRTGEETTVRRVFIHHNGQLGIAGSGGTGGVVEDSEIAENNIAGFRWGWEAGGAKFTETHGLVVRGNFVHDNEGPGLWTDINNYDTLYEFNTVEDNFGPGIFHEISYAATIRDNTVTGNGFGKDTWLWGSGILVAASSDVEIYRNTVTGNADGIGGIQQDREDGPEGPHLLSNMFVHDNTISVEKGQTGIVEDVGNPSVFTDRENRFESNTYVDTEGRRYAWLGREIDASAWQEQGQDLEGTWS